MIYWRDIAMRKIFILIIIFSSLAFCQNIKQNQIKDLGDTLNTRIKYGDSTSVYFTKFQGDTLKTDVNQNAADIAALEDTTDEHRNIIDSLYDSVGKLNEGRFDSLSIGADSRLQLFHVKTSNANTGVTAAHMSHDYYGALIESEDATLGLASEGEGGHGSGIDLMEVNNGVLANKWWLGRYSTGGDSRLQFTYGTNPDYAANASYLDITTNFRFVLANPLYKLAIGTSNTNSNAQLIFGSNNAKIAMDTEDGANTKRLQLAGGGTDGVTRGAYINLMGNQYADQEGDLALLAGNSEVAGHGMIRLFTGNTSERVRITSNGTTLIGTTDDDGTPPVGKLIVRSTSGAVHPFIFVGRSISGGSNVFTVDTNGVVTGRAFSIPTDTAYTREDYNGRKTAVSKDVFSDVVEELRDSIINLDSAAIQAFSPASLGRLVVWLRDDSTLITTVNDSVSVWKNLDYHGVNVRQDTAAQRRGYFTKSTGSINFPSTGHPSTTGWNMDLEDTLNLNKYHNIFFYLANRSNAVQVWMGDTAGYVGWSGSGQLSYYVKQGTSFHSQVLANAGYQVDSFFVYEFWRAGTTVRIYRNGHKLVDTIITNNLTFDPLTIMGKYDSTFGATVKLKEILVYDRALNETERNSMYRFYFRGKSHFRQIRVVCDGNSLTYGATGTIPYPTALRTLLGDRYKVINSGVNGNTSTQRLAAVTASVDINYNICAPSFSVLWIGTNDFFLSDTATVSNVYNNIVTYMNGRRAMGFKTIVCTVIPRLQDGTPANFESRRLELNTLLKNNYTSFADGIVLMDEDSRLQNPLNTTYFNADKVHLTNTGYAVAAELVYNKIKSIMPY
jgi:lysophospholipase L1-like esterase